MADSASPIASSVGRIDFSHLSAEEIQRVSVKRIRVSPTFDSLGGPVLGGLYDPALGAIKPLDKRCHSTTYRTDSAMATDGR